MIEVEDVVLTGTYVEGEGKLYRIGGSAVVDGETYPAFVIEFELADAPQSGTLEAIMEAEWDSYGFIFDLKA